MEKDATTEKATNNSLKNDKRAKELQKQYVNQKISFREYLHGLYTIQKEKILKGEL